MLNKMDKSDIFVPHPLVITSLLPLALVLGKKLRLKRLVLLAEPDTDEAEVVELILVVP